MAFSSFYPLLLALAVALSLLQQGKTDDCLDQLEDKDNVYEQRTFYRPGLYTNRGNLLNFTLTVTYPNGKVLECGENVTYTSVLSQPTISFPSETFKTVEKEKRFKYFSILFWASSKGKASTSLLPPYALWFVYDIPLADFKEGYSGQNGTVCFPYNFPLPFSGGRRYVFQLHRQYGKLKNFTCPTFRLSPFNVEILKELLPVDKTTLKTMLPLSAETMLQNLPPIFKDTKLYNSPLFFNETKLEDPAKRGAPLSHPTSAMYFKINLDLLNLTSLSKNLPAVGTPPTVGTPPIKL